ncbi:uncharacterized protein LOC6558788 [Drosophila grimshawi]|uniref:GH15046 n=1 Tax=Drosophila grimshawi TaxID=7222 RepID=B4IZW3_DROGR|nr:uncharacterized protein LOC6558788 [Drosophila grimshawi]EDV96735.1 GH15046 [Drosophila grimshawi]
MFSSLPRGSFLDEHICKDYGKEVLLSNWQERRNGDQKSDCITPAIKRVGGCASHLTESQDTYVAPWNSDETSDATRYFRVARIESFNNFKRNHETQVHFPITARMNNNFTTTYTIMYEIVPKEFRGRQHELDLLQSYGNRSSTYKRCNRRADLLLEKAQRLQTNYAADFVDRSTIQNSAGN